jgi:hypothetical protein
MELPGPSNVRTLATLILIGLLATCPLLCASVATGHGANCCAGADGPAGDLPVPCPGDGVCCICAGAIQPDEVRVSGLEALAYRLSFEVACLGLVQLPLHAPGHLTLDGAPTGLAICGDPAQVRALLQNFRC